MNQVATLDRSRSRTIAKIKKARRRRPDPAPQVTARSQQSRPRCTG
jgi:hypothetical protein